MIEHGEINIKDRIKGSTNAIKSIMEEGSLINMEELDELKRTFDNNISTIKKNKKQFESKLNKLKSTVEKLKRSNSSILSKLNDITK